MAGDTRHLDYIDAFARLPILGVLSFPNQFVAFLAGILVFQLLCAFPGSVPRTVLRAGLAGSVAAMVAIPFIAMALRGYGDSSRAATRHERGGEAGGRRRVDDARRISGFGKATTDD